MRSVELATSAGPVRGVARDDGILAFTGIPYAAAPVGARRFRPPEPAPAWRAPLDATRPPPAFPQPPADPAYLAGFGAAPARAHAEHALVANVWAPVADPWRPRPVMVLVHGGGYFSGSGTELPLYDGAAMARHGDVVVVSCNYRLGALGFLHLGDLDDAYAGAGNAGLLDLVALLRWVRDGITAFGGDPGRVTLFGSSAGGHAATALLAVPAARGLFHRVAAQSGLAVRCRDAAGATAAARDLLHELGVGPGELDRLAAIPVARVLRAQQAVARRRRQAPMELLGPVVDGVVLHEQPLAAVAGGRAADVPLLMGANGDEQGCQADVLAFAGARLAGAAAPTYAYTFAWATTAIDGTPRSCHGLELPFVTGNPDCPLVGPYPGRHLLAERMCGAWAHLGHDGRPGHALLPPWPPLRPGRLEAMRFASDCRVVDLADARVSVAAAGALAGGGSGVVACNPTSC